MVERDVIGRRRHEMMTWLNLALIHIIVTGIRAQHLAISPVGTQIKTVNTGIIFTCTLFDYNLQRGLGTWNDDADSTPVPPPDMRWVGPDFNYITATKGRVYVERYNDIGLRLYITKVQDSDAGFYTCKARLSNGRLISEETKLYLFEDIKFDETPTAVQHVIGSNPLIECFATGQPKPEMSWRLNRRKIPQDSAKYRQESRGLRISKLDLRDNGTYECRAEVASHGNLKVRYISVDVLYPPTIVREPSADMAVKGKQAKLTCDASGNPPVKYEWFKEDITLQPTGSTVRLRKKLASDGGSYVIRDVDTDDEGRYVCLVSNTLGSQEKYVNVTVFVSPSIETIDPVTVLEGRTVEMTCRASGVPPPRVTWRRLSNTHDYVDGTQLDDGRVMVQSINNTGVSTLVIQDVNRTYSGQYTCNAVNEAGQAVEHLSLTVEFLPVIEISGDKELVGWPGEVREWTCVGQGLPLPTVSWIRRHGGQHIVDSDVFTVATGRTESSVTTTLQVRLVDRKGVSPYDSYSCLAKNIHGYVSKDVRLRQAHSPDPPSNVSVLEETWTQVWLGAELPRNDGGSPVTHWSVKYELDEQQATSHTLRFDVGHNITVDGLIPGSDYTFHLAAFNAVGVGKAIKFRVKTPRRLTNKEQSDVPRKPSEDTPTPSTGEIKDTDAKNDQPYVTRLGPSDQPNEVMRSGTGLSAAGTGFGGFGIVFLGATVGVATVLAAILVAVVACFVTSSKRRKKSKQQRKPSDVTMSRLGPLPPVPNPNDFGFPSSGCDSMSKRQPDDIGILSGGLGIDSSGNSVSEVCSPTSLTMTLTKTGSLQRPQQPQHKYGSLSGPSTHGSRKNSRTSCTAASSTLPPSLTSSPKANHQHQHSHQPHYHAAPSCRYADCAGYDTSCPGTGTLQRRAKAPVDATVDSRQLISATSQDYNEQCPNDAFERPISMSELPPPPYFLLEGGSSGICNPPQSALALQQQQQQQQSDVSKLNGGGVGCSFNGSRCAPPLLFEIADGYRSGDSVDDDIDDVDPTIRTPSIFLQSRGIY